MRIDNIVKKLRTQEKVEVYKGEFDFKECWMCDGTALIDLVNGEVKDTTAKYVDVIEQIVNNKSHIYTQHDKNKELTSNYKLGFN